MKGNMDKEVSGIRQTAQSFKEGTSHLVKGEIKEAIEDYSAPFERSIGLIGVIIISLSAMLGSGIFVLPALAADSMSSGGTSGYGGGVWLSFLLAAAQNPNKRTTIKYRAITPKSKLLITCSKSQKFNPI